MEAMRLESEIEEAKLAEIRKLQEMENEKERKRREKEKEKVGRLLVLTNYGKY